MSISKSKIYDSDENGDLYCLDCKTKIENGNYLVWEGYAYHINCWLTMMNYKPKKDYDEEEENEV